MRIIHELQAGRRVIVGARRDKPWDEFRACVRPGTRIIGEYLVVESEMPPFQAYVTVDDVARWTYAQAAPDSGATSLSFGDFGPLRLPFDSMWMEWEVPSIRRDEMGPELHHDAWGIELGRLSNPQEVHPDAADGFRMGQIIRVRGIGIVYLAMDTKVVVDADGGFLGCSNDDPGGLAEWLGTAGIPWFPPQVGFGLSFMNVVNARRDNEPEHRSTVKALKKKGVIPIAMNRIRLPAARSSSRADVKAATGGTMPLHLVRGHFKTYTPDAPLFGKSTGTYWWGWQSRGKAERGVRGHTYEVGPGG